MAEAKVTRHGLVLALVSLACSVPSPPAERPEPIPTSEPEREPEPEPEPFQLPPADRLCGAECCPRGMPLVQLGARSSSLSACLVGDADANELVAGAMGDVVVAGGGDDVVHGGPMRDTILGDDGNDELHAGPGSDHIDAGFGDDVVEGGDHSDLILGGPGDDVIYGDAKEGVSAHAGADVIHGGPGSDTIDGGPGDDRILGGVDDDTLRGGPGKDIILGSVGNDVIEGGDEADWLGGEGGDDTIRGGEGSDRIHPGLGRDEAYGEGGNDTIIIPSACEIVAGELVDGGPGFDRVVSSLSEAELVERGVRFVSIEEFVVRSASPDTVCRAQDPGPRMIEVSGTVVATTTLFRDEQGGLRPQDGLFHTEWTIVTSYTLKVDTVYLGELESGSEIAVILPGGSIDTSDGTSRTSTGCCFTALHEGRRYRLELRELHDGQGMEIGWDYIWHVVSPVDHALVLRLADRGPIATAAAGPREQVGPECPGIPLPGSFKSNREAIRWANSLGHRWDQSVAICGGPQPCDVAAPAAAMDQNMTLPEGCEVPYTYHFVFGDGARLISAGAIIPGTWGIHAPGVVTNPTALTKCDTSNNGDARNCIALDVERPDLGGAEDQRNIGGFNGWTETRATATMKSLSWPTLKEIQEIDITLSATIDYGDVCEPGDFSYSQLVTHELGHAFGLAHTDDFCEVNMLESQKARWGAHEEARFRVLYPSREFEFPDNLYAEP